MSSSWSTPGRVDVERNGEVVRVRVAGNLHRDLATTPRDALEARIRGASDARGLVLNLADLVRLDSWGEGVLADLVDDVVAAGGRAAIAYDPVRKHHVRSLRVLLKRHADRARFEADELELRRWVTEEL